MANYLFTNTPGTTRRRAVEITLRFPVDGIPAVTFTEEDRVILADGKHVVLPVDAKRVINIDDDFMQKVFARRDIETGEVAAGERTGAEIFTNVFSAIADVYIQTGIEKDELLKKAAELPPPIESNNQP